MTQPTNTQFNQTATQLAKMLDRDMRSSVYNQLLLQTTDSDTVELSACDTYLAVKHTMPAGAAGELANAVKHHGLLLDADDVRAASKLLNGKRNPAELLAVNSDALVFGNSKDDKAEVKYQYLKDLDGYDQYSPLALTVWETKDEEPDSFDFRAAEVFEIAKATFKASKDKYAKNKRRLTFINYKGRLEAITFDDDTKDKFRSPDITGLHELGRTPYKNCPDAFYKSFGANMLHRLLDNVMPYTKDVNAFSAKRGNYIFESRHDRHTFEEGAVKSQFAMGGFKDYDITYADLIEARQSFVSTNGWQG